MFAVPGWNLSAPIATQVEKPKPQDPNKLGKKAQKRAKKQEEQVDEKNIGELWGKVVEGKGADGKEQKKTAERAEQQEDGAQEKRGKKRKRKGNKDAKDDTKGGQQDDVVGEVEATSPAAQKDTAADGESKRNKKKQKDHRSDGKAQSATTGAKGSTEYSSIPAAPVSLLPPEPKGLTPLQKSMRNKLASARFRHLNESLYTKPSKESLELFKEDPSMFEDYHRGFAQQVEVWPENPVDGYVNTVIARGKIRSKDPWKDKKRKDKKGKSAPDADIDSAPIIGRGDAKPLPRNMRGVCTIADLGCGTASLSYRLQSQLTPLNLTINSFDLSKPSGPSAPLVTVADISSLPLPDGSVDVAIFCLALMGTNWLDFIDEAYRVLRWRGELWVSEIKSRFGRVERRKPGQPPINSIGSLKKADKKKGKKKGGEKPEEEEGIQDSGDEAELAERVDGVEGKEGTDISSFVEILRKHGFVLDALPERQDIAIDLSNKMFVKMQFVKSAQPTKGKNAKRDIAASKPEFGNGLKMGMKGKKFTAITDEDAGDDGQDGKVLKPCLYKIR